MGIATPSPYLIAPSSLPDGSVVWQDTGGDVGACVEALRAYDERCSLVRNRVDDLWEVWRLCEDGEPRRVGFRPGARVPHGMQLVQQLAEHDTRRGYDPVKATTEHNDAVDRERARVAGERFEDKADRLAHALSKDLDMPAADGRFMPLGGPS